MSFDKKKVDELGDKINGAMMNRIMVLESDIHRLLEGLKPFCIAPDDDMLKPKMVDGVEYPLIDAELWIAAHQLRTELMKTYGE